MRTTIALVTALVLLAPVEAEAQGRDRGPRGDEFWPPPTTFVGGGLDIGVAAGDFSNYVKAGVGLGGHFLWRPDPDGPLALRIGGNFLIYGSTTRRHPLVPGITVDVTTSNQIAGLGIGPQLYLGRGPLQPYAYGTVGFSYFATVSNVSGSGSTGSPFASSTNYDDFTFATQAAGGLMVRLSRGRTPVALDLSARYVNNGRVTYVTESGVSVSGSTLVVSPIDSEANLVVYQIGVTVGLRSGDRDTEPAPRGRRR